MPQNTREWAIAIPVIAAAILLMAAAIVILPCVGVTYYTAKGYVRLVEKVGLGDE